MSFVQCPAYIGGQHYVAANGKYMCVDRYFARASPEVAERFMCEIEELFKLFNMTQYPQKCLCADIYVIHANGSDIRMIVADCRIHSVSDNKYFRPQYLDISSVDGVVYYVTNMYPDSFKKPLKVAQHFVDSDEIVDGSLD